MKIAFINIYQSKVFRGSETFVSELSKRLAKNHEVDVLTSIDTVRIWKKKYDVIIPTNGRLQAFLVRVITWLYRGKVIISGQSGIGFDDRLNLYSFPDRFVALTDYQLTWAKKKNPFVRSIKIPNGVDIKKFQNDESRLAGEKRVLSVGALEKNKRHELTIKAVSKIDGASLKIVGKGSEEKKLQDYGRVCLGGRFQIVSLPYNQIERVYKSADVFVFPTVPWESFGIVMLEAMASGLPVVAGSDPIRREVVGDAGILADPADVDNYARAIERALKTNWGDKPRKQAEKFDWDKIADKYEKLLNEL